MADRSSRLDFILALTDKVTAPIGKVKTTFSDLAEQSQENFKQMGIGLAGVTGSFVAINASLEPALEMNRALGDVRSLGVAENALESLNAKALEFSVAYGENAQEFVASAYQIEGAVKGLAGTQLATFTNTSNVLAKATKADKAVMSEYVGTLYNLQKQQADAMGKNEWVEKLGGQTALATQLFRTSGEAMKDAFKEAGAIATASGVDLAEQMAVIGTLSSTMEGGDAGGRYKAFFENIGNASEKLGIKFTDANGKAMPMLDILGKLEGKYGDLKNAAANAKLVEAFGGEGAQVIGALAQDTGRLRNGIEQLGKVHGLEQAERMAKAMVDPWQQFGAAVQALRIAFGQALIPILTPLMDRLVGIASTLTRWTQLFPNITRVIGITTLAVLGMAGGMGLLTFAVGLGKSTWLSLVTIWKVLTWTGWKSIAMFLYHTVMFTLFIAGMVAMYTWMGLVRVAMLAWQGAIWLVNAALAANPVIWIVVGIAALIAVVVLAAAYWDEWTTALMNTAAFQWVSAKLQALSDWFDSMGGWTGMAKAAWDGIVSIFQNAINGLIELINKIPGVNIEARVGDMPTIPAVDVETHLGDVPTVPGPAPVTSDVPTVPGPAPAASDVPTVPAANLQAPRASVPEVPGANLQAPKAQVPTLPGKNLSALLVDVPAVPSSSLSARVPEAPAVPGKHTDASLGAVPTVPVAEQAVKQAETASKSQQTQQALSDSVSSLAPARPNTVPKGGFLSSIQNTTNHNNTGNKRVENVNIYNSQPMDPSRLEDMLEMAVG